ncbi:glucosamine-6-phosphate deaminase NagB-II [Alteromonas gilva]|uniref:SIS domain-containing protein n=1 Tax=Alteromonas gilva TaxID=2987522 RepID=A0ABT5L1X6_9ALTE|nr:SIS domain-containing protein [Alteromonas gilva]MDC8829808.1 SIS domain-containing protein [Alteromonas gilva]
MTISIMAKEARQSAEVIANQLVENRPVCASLVETLQKIKPSMIMIIARGSSDHAGVFAKYLFEVELGIPVCAAAPSVSGIFNQQLNLSNALVIVISQSGRSPDILNQAKVAKQGGAYTVALVNDATSPLAETCDSFIPIRAGKEQAVAATKSYLASLSALLQLCAVWSGNEALEASLKALPGAMEDVCEQPPQLTLEYLANVQNCIVLGRAFGYAIAREVALKLKEVLGIHAESFSSAEFIHGPVTLAEKPLSIVDLAIPDESEKYHNAMIEDVKRRGARLVNLNCGDYKLHPRVLPLLLMQRFYLDIEQVAVSMGLDPDSPPGLNKVTETV